MMSRCTDSGSSGGVVLGDGGLLGCVDAVSEICCPVLPEPSGGAVEVGNGNIGRPVWPSERQGTIGGRVRSKSPASLAEERLGSAGVSGMVNEEPERTGSALLLRWGGGRVCGGGERNIVKGGTAKVRGDGYKRL